jgi:hypothetical protein
MKRESDLETFQSKFKIMNEEIKSLELFMSTNKFDYSEYHFYTTTLKQLQKNKIKFIKKNKCYLLF